MYHHWLFAFSFLLLFGCNTKTEEKKDTCTTKNENAKEMKMYKMSEMATLMEQMYVDNQRLKQRIKNGDTIGKFPNHFLQIHKAVMTDETDNDAFFKTQAALFIKSQELIYQDPANAKQHFNTGVDACVRCHEQKCSGPIPRIKKLYIETD